MINENWLVILAHDKLFQTAWRSIPAAENIAICKIQEIWITSRNIEVAKFLNQRREIQNLSEA